MSLQKRKSIEKSLLRKWLSALYNIEFKWGENIETEVMPLIYESLKLKNCT